MSEKEYCGNGKQVKDYDMVNVSVDLSQVPKDAIKEANNGRKYLNLTVSKRRSTDAYGNTHSVCINRWEPKDKEDVTDDGMPF